MARHRLRRLPAPVRRRISSRRSTKTAEVTDTLATNHGGIAAVAKPGIRLTALDLGIKPVTLELLSVRVVTGSSSCVVVQVYCTGPITSVFFAEFTVVLDTVATNVDPLYIVGDLNIRLDRTDDAWSRPVSYTHLTLPTKRIV